jgi:gliding motility-associated-like protein
MTVDSSNALLILKFACVLQYARNHPTEVEPRFRLTLYDARGNMIPDCSNYDVYAANSYVKGFNTYILPNSNYPVKWRDWTTVGANLMNYIGQTITIEFMSADCTGHLHFGYAYFVAECSPIYITTKYCAGDTVAKLTAPLGFESYSWRDKNGTEIDTLQNLRLTNPAGGDTYSCTMTSATGCVVTLRSTIAKYLPKADFSSYMIDCKSNTVQFVNLSSTTKGALQYKWDFGEGKISTQKNPMYTFATSGLHPMVLTLKNPPSSCIDTLKKVIESFSPPLVGIKGNSTYCPNLSTSLSAYGAYEYKWSNGSKAESIEVASPGGQYWLIGRSLSHSLTNPNDVCISDTIYKTVIEEPDWEFLSASDTTLCEGSNTVLSVSGADHYLWNTGDTTNSIATNTPGSYNIVASNKRGCEKSMTFEVKEYPVPNASFTTSTDNLNRKHNQITCNSLPQADVQYIWNMGDGTIKTGPSIQYSYEIPNSLLQYTISQKVVSIHDCVDSTYKIIDVTPFVPNVYSPNGDGINDLFMPDYDLQVYDRNGLVIYQGTTGWDGIFNGRPVDPDTYFYTIIYFDRNQHIQTKKGYVTLVR